MKKLFLICLLLPLIGTAQITTHWKDARFLAEPMKNLMVMSQFYDNGLRAQVESNMVDALKDNGIEAVAASNVLIYDSMYLYSTLERKLDSAGIDGILIVKMLEERGTDMYVLPEELIPPYAYNYYEYYSFYYYHDLPILMDPNYYRKPGRTFRIDAYLYQNKGDMAAWGGKSKNLNPLEPEKAIKKLGKSITKRMLQEGVIEKN